MTIKMKEINNPMNEEMKNKSKRIGLKVNTKKKL